jgi:hypothetical protein
MRHAPLITDSEIVLSHPLLLHRQKQKGFFAAILEALHHSRRLQAERYLRTNRHLIASSWDCGLKPNTEDDDNGDR